MNPDLKNAVLMQSPYVVANETPTGDEVWLQGTDISKSTLLSIDEAHELMADMPESAIFDRYLTDEEILSYFK